MLARSLTKCCHRPSLTTPLLCPPLRLPAQQRCRSSTQSSSTTSPPPPDLTTNSHDDTKPPDPPTTTATSPPPPNPTTTLHNSLTTFLAHAARTSLSQTSTTYIGTYYEYTVQHTLRHFGFNLSRTGGRGDAGIDLLGTWHLPPIGPPQGSLKVLVQCKALKSKLGPNLIRELEGAFVGAPPGFRQGPGGRMIGVLVSPREATKGVRDAMGRSRWPMVWVMLEVRRQQGRESGVGDGEGRVRQVLWNKAAGQLGLEGLDVTMRYDKAMEGEDGVGKECVLMWQGRPVPGLDEQSSSL